MKIIQMNVMSLLAMLLMACSSQPEYRAAHGSGYGYQATKLSETQQRVSFKARGSNAEKAMDYVLLRAAEVTLEQGYDWFIITHRDTLLNNQRVAPRSSLGYSNSREVVTRCGLVACTTHSYPNHEFSAGIHVGGDRSGDIQSIIEIKLGRGMRPDTDASFDAVEVIRHLGPTARND